jgi:REP element-mobilizing transposase RayT
MARCASIEASGLGPTVDAGEGAGGPGLPATAPMLQARPVTRTGWRSRGYLPHCDERGLVQHIIFGLFDSLPREAPPSLSRPDDRAEWADHELDVGHGCRILANPSNAEIVQRSLLHDDGEHYALGAWCIMPTHVHVLVELRFEATLADIVQTWKSATAHAINKREGRAGRLWRREYFDRFMRAEEQFENTATYIENNPVAASLCEKPEDWRFSSATWRRLD